jgi:membrane protease YdiL (CAAX protease family)
MEIKRISLSDYFPKFSLLLVIGALSVSFILFGKIKLFLTVICLVIFVIAIIFKEQNLFPIIITSVIWITGQTLISILRYWPISLIFPILVYYSIVLLYKKNALKEYIPIGDITKRTILLIVMVSVVSILALMVWFFLLHPNKEQYAALFPKVNTFILPFVGLGFAIINSLIEELMFRGIIYNNIEKYISNNKILIILLQSIPFATLHYIGGFPNGYFGILLTFIYGILLGEIRSISKGLLAPIIAHIFTDFIIFYIVYFLINKT